MGFEGLTKKGSNKNHADDQVHICVLGLEEQNRKRWKQGSAVDPYHACVYKWKIYVKLVHVFICMHVYIRDLNNNKTTIKYKILR